jgi:CDP-6-deoxy-D-xylo-4-hexulose-3-dehydrase
VVGSLDQTDLVMTNTLWVGVYPGLTDDMLDYVIESIGAIIDLHVSLPSRS